MTINLNGAQQFYDDRYLHGYMEDWPASKKRRVCKLIQELGLPERGKALDFGCGQGVFTAVLRDALPQWEIFGVELSEVALDLARKRVPGCTFVMADSLPGGFDLVMTHHVLEHVVDLDRVLGEMSRLLKQGGLMLHILPCRNPGSFEHRLCSWHIDGIQAKAGNRFFFEDPGHVRRLTSSELISVSTEHGFAVIAQNFANHFWGAVDWITDLDFFFIRNLTVPTRAPNAAARIRLCSWYVVLTGLRLAKRIRWFDVDKLLKRAAESEWRKRSQETSGSEMYVLFILGGRGESRG